MCPMAQPPWAGSSIPRHPDYIIEHELLICLDCATWSAICGAATNTKLPGVMFLIIAVAISCSGNADGEARCHADQSVALAILRTQVVLIRRADLITALVVRLRRLTVRRGGNRWGRRGSHDTLAILEFDSGGLATCRSTGGRVDKELMLGFVTRRTAVNGFRVGFQAEVLAIVAAFAHFDLSVKFPMVVCRATSQFAIERVSVLDLGFRHASKYHATLAGLLLRTVLLARVAVVLPLFCAKFVALLLCSASSWFRRYLCG